MTLEKPLSGRRPSGPTDLPLGATGAAAAVATVLFYGALVFPLSDTYFGALFGARGWVPYVIAFLSLWAGIVLVLKYRVVTRQREALQLDLLPQRIAERISPEDAPAFTAHLETLPESLTGNLLVQRIRHALHHYEARRDAREVVDQLGNQAQADADAVESSYTMVRVFIWAVPILGFIGTVVGIGAAIGGFSESVGAAVDLAVMKNSIGTVTSGLGVAFDTTLVALVMSILIMFPASSLQKSEEDFLSEIDAYCDERMVRRLEDAGGNAPGEAGLVEQAVAREMELHRTELRSWLDRLEHIGEAITAHVVSGWEKIDEQMRVRQDQQLDQLGRWASTHQREASEELGETQRGLLRDFRTSLEGMAAEARRVQEEGVHRVDDQLAGIERLHRRLQEDQAGAAEAHRSQTQTLTTAAEQLAHTLSRVRGEAAEVRDESARQLSAFSEQLGELASSVRDFQRGLVDAEQAQARTLRESAERLSGSLGRADDQLGRLQEASAAHLASGSLQLEMLERARDEARRRDADVHEAQLAALSETTRQLGDTLETLRGESRTAQARLTEALANADQRLARAATAIEERAGTASPRSRMRRIFRKG